MEGECDFLIKEKQKLIRAPVGNSVHQHEF